MGGDLGAAGSGGGSGVRGDVHAARIGGVGPRLAKNRGL